MKYKSESHGLHSCISLSGMESSSGIQGEREANAGLQRRKKGFIYHCIHIYKVRNTIYMSKNMQVLKELNQNMYHIQNYTFNVSTEFWKENRPNGRKIYSNRIWAKSLNFIFPFLLIYFS